MIMSGFTGLCKSCWNSNTISNHIDPTNIVTRKESYVVKESVPAWLICCVYACWRVIPWSMIRNHSVKYNWFIWLYMRYSENNGIFRVTVECLLSSGIKANGRRLFSFKDLFLPYFIKLCLNIHPKIPLKCDFSIRAGPNPFTFWSTNFQIE
jgi:hypothetical protein